jgi:gliding motility-associated-like protein
MLNHLLTCLAGIALLLPAAKNIYSARAGLHPLRYQTEICDNGIDDDGDGLIDLNDPDCDCPTRRPASLIPNPSFEARNCCPQDHGDLHCADTWIQASEPTTDYLHPCGWMGWDYMPAPLPFPDGDACIGFRDGAFRSEDNPHWKEYAGACLLQPLKAGKNYRIRFNVGFSHAQHSPPTDITFFGTVSCSNLPFGIGNTKFGCPSNDPTWRELGSVRVSGANEWKVAEINITPTQDIQAVAIGPDCSLTSSPVDRYYFFDNLILADEESFEFKITAVGEPCSREFSLLAPTSTEPLQYQWYKDGVALVGETNIKLTVTTGGGTYVARVVSPSGCAITPPFQLEVPVFYGETSAQICKGEAFNFNNESLTEPGVYFDTLQTERGCDSIVKLTLVQTPPVFGEITQALCRTDSIIFNNQVAKAPGVYFDTLQTERGCDSIIKLTLVQTPPVFGEITQALCRTDSIIFNDQIAKAPGVYFDTLQTAKGCDSIVKLTLTPLPPTVGTLEAWICRGDTFVFDNQRLTEPGIYYDTLKNSVHCDSVLQLTLDVRDGGRDTLVVKIFEGETYRMDGRTYNSAGTHDLRFPTPDGCDSLLHLVIDYYKVFIPNVFSPNADGNNDAFSLFGDRDLVLIKNLEIFDRWGNLVFQNTNFLPNEPAFGWNGQIRNQPAPVGVYVYTTLLLMDDGRERRFSNEVLLLR